MTDRIPSGTTGAGGRHARPRRLTPLAIAVAVAATAGASAGASVGCVDANSSAGPVISPSVVADALDSHVPKRPTLSDDLDFYTRRLAERGPEDRLAQLGLLRASQLRFSVYGHGEDLARAESVLAEWSAQREPTPGLLSAEASVRLARHDFPGAVASARRAVQRAGAAGRDVSHHMRLFDALLAVGAYEEAAGLLELHWDRTTLPYVLRQVRWDDRQGHTEAARDGMEHALRLADAYAEPRAFRAWAHTETGHFFHHTGEPERAVAHYLAALQLTPGAPAPLAALGWLAFTEDRNPAAATDILEHALTVGGEIDLLLQLRDIALWEDDARRAARYAAEFERRARAEDPSLRLHRRALAWLLAEREDGVAEAVALARADLDHRPTSESWGTLAWALTRAGELEGACRAAGRALERVSPEPRVLYQAGVAYQACGDAERGRALLHEALDAESELGPWIGRDIRGRLGFRASKRR